MTAYRKPATKDTGYIEHVNISSMFKGVIVREATAVTKCHTCRREIWIDTDGNGHLVALNPSGTQHECSLAELGEGTIEEMLAAPTEEE